MDIRKAILQEHSKAQTRRIAAYIGDDAERFAGLMHLFFTDEYRVVQRGSWIIGEVAENQPKLAAPYLEQMIAVLQKKEGVHPGVKRNIVRLFQFVDIPGSIQGTLTDVCFGFLADPQVPVAIRACSITVLTRLVKAEPDLANELRLMVEDMQHHAEPSLHARIRESLKSLDKIQGIKRYKIAY